MISFGPICVRFNCFHFNDPFSILFFLFIFNFIFFQAKRKTIKTICTFSQITLNVINFLYFSLFTYSLLHEILVLVGTLILLLLLLLFFIGFQQELQFYLIFIQNCMISLVP